MEETTIFICRLGGSNVNSRSCYLEKKRRQRLIYLTVRTPDGLILNIHEPEVSRSYVKKIYRQSRLEEEHQQQSN